MNVRFLKCGFIDKFGNLFQLLLFLLFFTYLINLCLSYFGLDYSAVFHISYLFQLFFVIVIHFKYDLKLNGWYLALFLFSCCTTILSVFFAILSSSQIPIFTPLLFLLTAVLFPLLFANFFLRCLNIRYLESLHLVFYYVIFKSMLYIILMPVELIALNRSGFSVLQFTGGQYHNIGILLLTLSFAYYFEIQNKIKLYIHLLLFVTVFLSFSRMAMLVYFVVLLYFAFFVMYKLIFEKGLKNYLIFSLVLFLFFNISNFSTSNEYINDFFNYWRLRLNQAGDDFDYSSIFDASYVESGRGMLVQLFYEKVNFLNLLLGYGIGSSQYVLSEFSHGQFHFGSFHNLILTVVAERGVLFGFFFIFFIVYMIILQIKNRHAIFFFILFLVFSITTGVELFVNSRDINFDITLLLLFFFSAARFSRLLSYRI
jgi:hypothetical protein